ncbi:hypothetical protein EX30DRAFT_364262 [Ascodesmis nigricans]|uniref:BTB domain-containing protein n=1 Tax=Ascodesmis nigricans TaxID=341454 RepID=A0A4V3SIQ0_9PEZI|nr:hypothetical protein EX30DRAFT_364262 [Ascodesmis nigricans]
MATNETNGTNGFSSQFTSEPFTVCVGPNKTAFHINRDILTKIPYFASLLSFPGIEPTKNNSCHLNTSVDTEDAFDMVAQYAYTSRYSPPDYLHLGWRAHSHAEVYVMAERLMMEDLMQVAVKQMAWALVNSTTADTIAHWERMTNTWKTESASMIAPECIVQVVGLIYSNTKDDEVVEQKTIVEVKGEGKGAAKESDPENEKKQGDAIKGHQVQIDTKTRGIPV